MNSSSRMLLSAAPAPVSSRLPSGGGAGRRTGDSVLPSPASPPPSLVSSSPCAAQRQKRREQMCQHTMPSQPLGGPRQRSCGGGGRRDEQSVPTHVVGAREIQVVEILLAICTAQSWSQWAGGVNGTLALRLRQGGSCGNAHLLRPRRRRRRRAPQPRHATPQRRALHWPSASPSPRQWRHSAARDRLFRSRRPPPRPSRLHRPPREVRRRQRPRMSHYCTLHRQRPCWRGSGSNEGALLQPSSPLGPCKHGRTRRASLLHHTHCHTGQRSPYLERGSCGSAPLFPVCSPSAACVALGDGGRRQGHARRRRSR